TYYHAQQGKYGFAELFERFQGAALPEIEILSLAEAKKTGTLRNNFTEELLQAIQQRVEQKEQVLLFQNRRGYAPYVHCEECEYIPVCNKCSVSLTHHNTDHSLKCHYCGYKEFVPASCPVC